MTDETTESLDDVMPAPDPLHFIGLAMSEAAAKDFFEAHEAACLWIEMPHGSIFTTMLLDKYRNADEMLELASAVKAKNIDKYILIRRLIEAKIADNCGRPTASTEHQDMLEDYGKKKERGCLLHIVPAKCQISRGLLIEIADAINERPRFLFPDKVVGNVDALSNAFPSIPDGIDASVVGRLQAIIDTANHFWAGVTDSGDCPSNTNQVIPYLMDTHGFSKRNAEALATVIRPDWAKEKTWSSNKKR